eukprot:TRINITY_DN21655_c0_g1_i2.p1 TRINITY_DN21655_c0_g1~~TRINITY_DN21655_c0_g1_i2.p1  ORF type:complete len:179 (-),score=53.91 TRINITY_DN21655_c0_g1_i2:422-958(-)
MCIRDRWRDIDLSLFNRLQDTVSMVFTKQYGFRFSSIAHEYMSEPIPVGKIDFTRDAPGVLGDETEFELVAQGAGQVHAVLCYWEVRAPGSDATTNIISTSPAATKNNFARDMQWGQALQLVEAGSQAAMTDPGHTPSKLLVELGDRLVLTTKFSEDSVVLGVSIEKVTDMDVLETER